MGTTRRSAFSPALSPTWLRFGHSLLLSPLSWVLFVLSCSGVPRSPGIAFTLPKCRGDFPLPSNGHVAQAVAPLLWIVAQLGHPIPRSWRSTILRSNCACVSSLEYDWWPCDIAWATALPFCMNVLQSSDKFHKGLS